MSQSTVAIIAGAELADYHFGEQHPFGPGRHQAFLNAMQREGLSQRVDWLDPSRCAETTLHSFHSKDYIRHVKNLSMFGVGYLDQGDTPARQGIFDAGCAVVGSVLDLVDRIMAGEYRRGFIPIAGLHHGYRDHCSGFCVFNDCAIAIEHLRQQYKVQKILYVDIDAHHGDGVFYNYDSDSNLYMVDFHEDGKHLYPGTGDAGETGTGAALGTMMNFPMPMHAGDQQFFDLWPKAEAFMRSIEPEFILFQCGADSLQGDPITHLAYTQDTHHHAAQCLSRMADDFCEGRMIGLGGGGYNLENIASAWPAVVSAMLE